MNAYKTRLITIGILLLMALVFTPSNSKASFTHRIVFESTNGGSTWTPHDLYIMNSDGTNQVNLTDTPEIDDHYPVFSPDGTKIAFHAGGGLWDSQIYVMNADGTNKVNITNLPGTYSCCPDWSPDGQKITFTSTRSGDWEIYVMNADGSNPQNLTNSPGFDHISFFSPDGTKLLFSSQRATPELNQVYVMGADGSNPTRLTHTDNLFSGTGNWSPDGTKIAYFSGDLIGCGGEDCYEIYIMNADGSNPVRLTFDNQTDFLPKWSPDGTQLVYFKRFGAYYGWYDYEIYTINIDGSNETRLTYYPGEDAYPSWEPDGLQFSGLKYSFLPLISHP